MLSMSFLSASSCDHQLINYRAHEYNTSCILLTFLPYHTTPLFLNLLSILPTDLTPTFKVLYPYKNGLINPPRHSLVHSATTNNNFFSALNEYALKVCRQQAQSHTLLSFWAGIITEAVSGMLDNARSGRREFEKQKHEEILFRVLAVLNSAFAMKKIPELIISCYMISVVVAQKASLTDSVIDGLMESVVVSWTEETLSSGLICLAVLAQRKPSTTLSKKVFKAIIRLDNTTRKLSEVTANYQTSKLYLGLVAGCLKDLDKHTDDSRLVFLSSIFEINVFTEGELREAITIVLNAASDPEKTRGMSLDVQKQLAELIQKFGQSSSLQPIFRKTLAESSLNIPALEHNLQTVVDVPLPPQAIEDVNMEDVDDQNNVDTFTPSLESLAKEPQYSSSFLSKQFIPQFEALVQVFALAVDSETKITQFNDLQILNKAEATISPQFLSFFIRVFSGNYPIGIKAVALKAVSSSLSSTSENLDLQAILPFLFVALTDHSERIRREATGVLVNIHSLYKKAKKDNDSSTKPWAHDLIYGKGKQSTGISWLSVRDVQKVLERASLPGLEEYILDSNHIVKVIDATLRGTVLSDESGAVELKKSLRLNLFIFLCSHAIRMPVFAPKFGLLRLLNNVKKVSGTTRTKELLPLIEIWRALSQKEVDDICRYERLPSLESEQQVVSIVSPKDPEAINVLLSNVSPSSQSVRPAFVTAGFVRMKEIWSKLPEGSQLTAAEKLLDISLGLTSAENLVADNCRDVLRSVELSGPILVDLVRKIPASLTDVDAIGPAPKRRRTSQNNMVAMTVKDEAELSRLMDKMTFILEIVDSSNPGFHPELADGLFQTLAALHHFKSQIQSGMSYLLSLTLGSLLAIVNKSKVSCPLLFRFGS